MENSDEDDTSSDSVDETESDIEDIEENAWTDKTAVNDSQLDTETIKIDCEQLVKSLHRLIKELPNKEYGSTVEDALKLNEILIEQLENLRKLFMSQVARIRSRLKLNAMLIKVNKKRTYNKVSIRGALLKGATFYLEGNMFFKDFSGHGAPNNADYIQRKKEGEFFPMDLGLVSRHYWTEKDKKSLVCGIKEQLVNRLIEKKLINVRWESKEDYLCSSKLKDLLDKVDAKFSMDWFQISAGDLKHRHSETSCEAIWNVFLHPSLKRSKWSREENNRLITAAQKYNFQNWEAIGKEVGGRSDYQCYIQYRTNACYNLPNRFKKWDKNDDAKLIELVNKNTTNNVTDWTTVTSYFRFKPKGDVIARYTTRLKPNINHNPFSPEEDLLLIGLVKKYGEKFNAIPRQMFPDRTILQLRNRYLNTLKHRHRNTTWTYEDDKKLAEFVSEHGTSSWLQCAELLGNHTRTSCRTRYLTIKKFYEKNPNSNLKDLPRHRVLKSDNLIRTDMYQTQLKLVETEQTNKLKYQSLKTKKPGRSVRYSKEEKEKYLFETLQSLESEMHERFKFGHDYSVFNACYTKWPLSILAKNIMANTLKVHTPTPIDHVLLSHIPVCFQKTVAENMQISNKNLDCLPPNYSSTIGYRALCLLGDVSNTKNEKKVYQSAAVKLFEERLMSTFFSVAITCTLNPTKLNTKPLCLINEDDPYRNNEEKIVYCDRYYIIPTDVNEPQKQNNEISSNSNLIINNEDCSSLTIKAESTEEPILKRRRYLQNNVSSDDITNTSKTINGSATILGNTGRELERLELPSCSLEQPGTSTNNSIDQIKIKTENRFDELEHCHLYLDIVKEEHVVSEPQ
ncbi:snRNA-activating protein complex subunit 4-like [Teleopsis dalmanni]|uniref:snRNA-activating protein complex subunit 4-like n=1 Tax=Teleopsis dalmanni TaxID=139649 RepID=UPI0018CEA102|nr:snRNA-activating protein complex subunit 4-like [Teleopsis dalmanni]XP_037952305.1 snRNA-activating protein complex subunit 4-like [Teleopsis dalmanni]